MVPGFNFQIGLMRFTSFAFVVVRVWFASTFIDFIDFIDFIAFIAFIAFMCFIVAFISLEAAIALS